MRVVQISGGLIFFIAWLHGLDPPSRLYMFLKSMLPEVNRLSTTRNKAKLQELLPGVQPHFRVIIRIPRLTMASLTHHSQHIRYKV